MPPERKVLLVLDQFEQWLFARRAEEDTELIAALRQCDGEHVQAVALVRDEPWAHGLLSSRANSIMGGTSEIQRGIISERLLGLPREPKATVAR